MAVEFIDLQSDLPGARQSLAVHRFGVPGARPLVYVQGALHADEIPGMAAARALADRLEALDRQGRVRGEIVVVPVANPIGLGQRIHGHAHGRFDLATGVNFNRGYAALTDRLAQRLEGRLGADEDANRALIREAMRLEIAVIEAVSATDRLKRTLLSLAAPADVVLDLHCDSEAVVHLYTLTPFADRIGTLGRLLGAQAILLAVESGDEPFDEAASRPWLELRDRFPGAAIPLGCFAVTVELRGQQDVDAATVAADADALVAFLVHEGAIEGALPDLPDGRCEPTPLAASEPLTASTSGIVMFHAAPGDRLEAGALVAVIVDPVTGAQTEVRCQSAGLLYARSAARFAVPGQRLGKVAGSAVTRSGKLLSP
ncbi:succinylglutamate desuccinylase/aspartoacylase [Alsobacter metallidurans]|uniref:Succinylglutamate desuccinylase/aspartoacylase n=1 Tax=Alsobacter metallidurans TaxID=340221 RepID=A0A917I832_9HYPH|nr:succinylglutamate desuccinylase/aspartoacylase family protein [Alsobacter metallidurans]GGH24255.1 succinylglutamate desuccinylase/aspartoacylase [Alsobacter metallidurans]